MGPWRLVLSSLVLQFDGSLRPPRDTGFPTTASRLGSCAAALLSEEGEVLALGGKTLPVFPAMTSADAEFEGLLMGLKFLKGRYNWDGEELVVEGDCKAIIDQLNNHARSRKLETKLDKAREYLNELNATTKVRHILRDQNKLTDGICEAVIRLVVEEEIRQFRNGIEVSSEQLHLSTMLEDYLGRRSIIPYSRRLSLYDGVRKRASGCRDGVALVDLGKLIENDSNVWSKSNDVLIDMKESLLAEAVRVQIRGYELLGRPKEVAKLARKHRYRLAAFPEMLNFQSHEPPEIETAISYGVVGLDATVWEQHTSDVFSSIDESHRSGNCEAWKIVE